MDKNLITYIETVGQNAKEAAQTLSTLTSQQKDLALTKMAEALKVHQVEILAANQKDLANAIEAGLSSAMVERLTLNDSRIDGMASGIMEIVGLADPVGEVIGGSRRPNGMRIKNVRVPLGVVGIIYESRPNVTSDAAALCLKAGNAVILRGGKEAINSNIAIEKALKEGITSAGLPEFSVQVVQDTSREVSNHMMTMRKYIDVLIPRGGAGLISAVVENANIPVIETGVGNCHVFVDSSADLEMAVNIIDNAKTTRPSVCNSAETLLVHRDIAEAVLPKIYERLTEKSVEFRVCEETAEILSGSNVQPAVEDDFYEEFLDFILAVKIVGSIDEAVKHIIKYSSGHSECIVTESQKNAELFTAQIDSAALYVNASTRFTDGGVFGMGAEIGISTQKLHVRGPMGLKELTTNKYIIIGEGQIR